MKKKELIVRLNESNKNNEFLRNLISSQDEKMKSLEQELVESKTKIENLTSSKLGMCIMRQIKKLTWLQVCFLGDLGVIWCNSLGDSLF